MTAPPRVARPSVHEITALIVTYNRADMLDQAVRSALSQVGGPPQIIVVDDASSDHTAQVLARYPTVTVHRPTQRMGKASASRNAGLPLVTTPWVAFLDDDDIWAPDKLEAQIAALQADPAALWCYPAVMVVDPELTPIGSVHPSMGGDIASATLRYNVVLGGGSGVLAYTDTVREAGGFDESLFGIEDWDLWTRMAQLSPVAVADRPVLVYRQHPGNQSRNPQELVRDLPRMHAKYAALRERDGLAEPTVEYADDLCMYLLGQGRRWSAAALFARSAAAKKSPRLALLALAAVVKPAWLPQHRSQYWREQIPAAWLAEVESWLAAYRR